MQVLNRTVAPQRDSSIFIKHHGKEGGSHCHYIIFRQEISLIARAKHGCPYVWKPIATENHSPPRDESSFHTWLWNLVKKHGSGVYRIVRNQAEGERAGFHPVFYGYVDESYLEVQRSYSDYKSHPNLPASRQAFFKIPKKRREMMGA
jgi:hypothetical protein